MNELIPVEAISSKIFMIRNQKVMLDTDLADLYGVSTKRLNEQVRRNRKRFPPDFMFALTAGEKEEVVAKCDHLKNLKYSPTLPLAYTEHGALMAASVLKSQRAVEVSIYVVRAFVKLREMLATNKKMAQRFDELEKRLTEHDENFQVVFEAIKQLLEEDEKPKRKIGF